MATDDDSAENADEEPSLRQQAAAERAFQELRDTENPFAELAAKLRDRGATFPEIYDQYAAVEEALGEAAMAEESELIPEWEITVKIPAPDTPSNYRYETRVRTHRDRGVAEQEVEMAFGYDVVPEKTKQVGYAEVL
ncbi:hypothetical protein ACFQDD_02030 [Halorubrum pallidum]|uniref:Uncharacterized protein n=1 Tax=Halorubrum pallidum TaxID=1526114 RepID=A0ABD5SZ02_9EURY